MARKPNDPPETFARMVARAIRREMGDRRMSDSALARRLGKSPKYVSARLDEIFEFSLNDVENFCLYIGVNPEDFIALLDRNEEAGAPRDREAEDLLVEQLQEIMLRDDPSPVLRIVGPRVQNPAIDEPYAAGGAGDAADPEND